MTRRCMPSVPALSTLLVLLSLTVCFLSPDTTWFAYLFAVALFAALLIFGTIYYFIYKYIKQHTAQQPMSLVCTVPPPPLWKVVGFFINEPGLLIAGHCSYIKEQCLKGKEKAAAPTQECWRNCCPAWVTNSLISLLGISLQVERLGGMVTLVNKTWQFVVFTNQEFPYFGLAQQPPVIFVVAINFSQPHKRIGLYRELRRREGILLQWALDKIEAVLSTKPIMKGDKNPLSPPLNSWKVP